MTERAEASRVGDEPPAPTVFIVDDDPVVRAVVRSAAASIRLAAEGFASAAEFLARLDPARPGCALLDVRLPGMSGLELQAALAAAGAPWPIIIITGYADVGMAVRALRAGALDFLEKPLRRQLLLDRMQEAVARDREKRQHAASVAALIERLGRLTRREREVLSLIVVGQASKTIAATLALSHKTIETHRSNLMVKTGAGSLAELIRLGLLLEGGDALAGPGGSAYGTPLLGRSRR
ncbi:MAG: response regulator [bacterium]